MNDHLHASLQPTDTDVGRTPGADSPGQSAVGPNPKSLLRAALVGFLALSLLTGVLYPLLVTGIAQVAFPDKAHGSLIYRNGTLVGSRLLGQSFSDPRYFWGRPSATADFPYNATASGGSNLGPTNPALVSEVSRAVRALLAADPANRTVVPVDLVTSSGSGLDPDISPAAAAWQVDRVARARGLDHSTVQALVRRYTSGRSLGVLGRPRVRVLELNLALDALGR